MSEGRKLDALVAEKVFGFSGVGHYGPPHPNARHYESVLCGSHDEALALYEKHWNADALPHIRKNGVALCHWKEGWGPLHVSEYSTETCDVWEVVEKMRERGFRFLLHDGADVVSSWYARMEWEGGCVDATEDTAPLAICRAALQAMDAQRKTAPLIDSVVPNPDKTS